MNFILSCGQAVQKYDRERDEDRAKFDLARDEALRQFIAAMLGVKLDDGPSKTSKPPVGEQKRSMTREDIMRSYAK